MRLSSYALALVVAAPAVAWSQGGADTKLPFETMQANVAKIVAPQEKERWQANVAIWQLKLDRAGAMEKADLDIAIGNPLAVEFQVELDGAVRGGMRRAHLEFHDLVGRIRRHDFVFPARG